MTTIMVVTITIYVNTRVTMTMTMTMTGTTTMIMTMVLTKTMIIAMLASTTMTKIFKQVQQDNFYCLLKMIKKGYENSICTSSLKNRCYFSLLSLLNLLVESAMPHKNP